MGGPSPWQESQAAVKTVGISCAGRLEEEAWDGHAASRREKAAKINENKGWCRHHCECGLLSPGTKGSGRVPLCERWSDSYHDSFVSGHCFPCARHWPAHFLPAIPRGRWHCCLQKRGQRHKEDKWPAHGDTVGGEDIHFLAIPPGQALRPGLAPELVLLPLYPCRSIATCLTVQPLHTRGTVPQ